MPRGIYFDVHVPASITDGLMRRGIDVLTAQADGAGELDDESLLLRATERNRFLFTQDEDFLEIGAAWQSQCREFCGIVYSHHLAQELAMSSSNWNCSRLVRPTKNLSTMSFTCRCSD